ncbi:MAG: phosphocholine cytidylyltransferase family protein [Parachlamydiaceae bacterium]|nr:phosphocholine cytidylyltransferase family protein [Parachlamydiaceae bacterium]
MKVIILAAGVGRRLNDTEDHLPKPLTELVNGKSILENQLDNLTPFISLRNVIIVVGYHKEVIINKFPSLFFIENPFFSVENTSKSLFRALNAIDEDVMWINGDVVFRPSIIEKVLQVDCTSMVVNESPVGEEEVKYRANSEGRILEVSKTVSNADGEALGINFFKKKDLSLLKKHLDKCKANDYFEKGIEGAIGDGLYVWKVPVAISDCVEIDFPEDLSKANKILSLWSRDNKNEK